MSTQPAWFQHFSTALQTADPKISLSTAISSGLISEEEYLNWACEFYQKPILEKKYFNEHKPSQEFWKSWKNNYKWSSSCLPIGEWDGHLLVACLEPVTLPFDFYAIYLLSSVEAMNEVWNSWNPPAIPSSLDIQALISSQSSEVLENTEHQTQTKAELNPESAEDSEGSEGIVVAPEGFNLQSAVDPSSLTFSKVTLVPKENSQPIVKNEIKKDDLSTKTGLTKTNLTKTNTNVVVSVPKNSASTEVTKTAIPAASTPKIPSSLPKIPTHSQVVEVSKTKEVASIAEESVITTMSAVNASSRNISITDTAEQSWLESLQLKDKKVFDELGSILFQTLKAYFEQSMILSYNELTTTVTTILWDENFPNNVTRQKYNISTPNIFKITKNTEKPFHGSPVINEFNEKFFEDWHSGDIPDHLTIIPLVIDGKVIGMVYNAGSKSSNTNQALKFAESKINEWLSQMLEHLSKQAA